MSTLSVAQKTILESALGMQSGYVLDFTNNSFAAFFADLGIDIYDNQYAANGSSKANRLRALWEFGAPTNVAASLFALVEYIEAKRLVGQLDQNVTDESVAKIRGIAQAVSEQHKANGDWSGHRDGSHVPPNQTQAPEHDAVGYRTMISHDERFRMKTKLLDELRTQEWDGDRISLLLTEFGVTSWTTDWNGPSLADVISSLDDSALAGVYRTVFPGQKPVGDETESTDSWKQGYVRVFFSHSAVHKQYVTDVAANLEKYGIHAFVAHETMKITRDWQDQIEQALDTMHAFVAFMHAEFSTSAWCQQELGWALGRRVPHFAIRMGVDPMGFIARTQWPSLKDKPALEVADQVFAWLCGQTELGSPLRASAFQALADARSYYDARDAARRVVLLPDPSEDDFARICQAWWDNDQVGGSTWVRDELQPFFKSHGKPWPPVQPGSTSQ